MTLTHHQAGLAPFLLHANEEQKKKILPLVGREKHLMGYALTEPNAGSDAASMRTRADKTDDGYILNGSKCFITSAGLSDTYVVFATMDPAAGKGGVTVFLVHKDTPGFTVGKKEDKMGFRGSPTRQISFQDAFVPGPCHPIEHDPFNHHIRIKLNKPRNNRRHRACNLGAIHTQ